MNFEDWLEELKVAADEKGVDLELESGAYYGTFHARGWSPDEVVDDIASPPTNDG